MPESFNEEIPEKRVHRVRIEGLFKQLEDAPIETEQDIVHALVLSQQLEDAIVDAGNAGDETLYTREEIDRLHSKRFEIERRTLIREDKNKPAEDLRTPERLRAALEILKNLSNPNSSN